MLRFPLAFTLLVCMLGGAHAQEVVALAIEGWSQEERSGTTYFRCASAICASGSVVSFRRQPHRPGLPLSAFEDHHRRLSANAVVPPSSVRSASVRDFREQEVAGARVLSARRDVVWTSGRQTSHVDALVIGSGGSYSVVSDAGRADWANANFSGFLPRIVDLAMLNRPEE